MALRALAASASGMMGMQRQIDVIANNLANVNTNGFKKQRAEFQDLLYQYLKLPAFETGSNPTGIQVGLGTKVSATNRLFHQGSLAETGEDLDWAINGEGFFAVTNTQGTLSYTRDGAFKVNSQGDVVTANGMLLEPGINIDRETYARIEVSPDGQIYGFNPDAPEAVNNLGTITLYRFPNPAGLEARGQNLFGETPSSGNALQGQPGQEGLGEIHQRFLEDSNVEVVRELVDMISTQRAFEMNGQAIQTVDQMLQTVNTLRR